MSIMMWEEERDIACSAPDLRVRLRRYTGLAYERANREGALWTPERCRVRILRAADVFWVGGEKS